MSKHKKVLIVGAGKRVQHAILPALVLLGYDLSEIEILRRDNSDVQFLEKSVKPLTSTCLLGSSYDLILNCANASNMMPISEMLRRRYPEATILSDTPSSARFSELLRTRLGRASKPPIYSLEDWPYLPNLMAMKSVLPESETLVIAHIGIVNHFLSVWRQWKKNKASLNTRSHRDARPSGPARFVFVAPKDVLRAYAKLRSAEKTITDNFLLTKAVTAGDDAQLRRTYLDGRLEYSVGDETLLEFDVPPDILRSFEPLDNRRNVHELDKVLALTLLLRMAVNRDVGKLYSYQDSLTDSLWARMYQRAGWGRRLLKIAR